MTEQSFPQRLEKILNDPRYFAYYVYSAIRHDFNFSLIVSSHTQARVKNPASFPHGAGKTTRLLKFLAEFNSPDFPMNIYKKMRGDWEPSTEDWNIALENMRYYPVDMVELMLPAEEGVERPRTNMIGWDDVQWTAPKRAGTHPLVEFIGKLQTVGRQTFAIMGMSAPNVNRIALPLRENCHFECIVQREPDASFGYYEIQKTNWFKNLYKPSDDLAHLRYLEEGTFTALPRWVDEKYRRWRDDQQRRVLTQEYINQVAHMVKRITTKGSMKLPENVTPEEYAEKMAEMELQKQTLKEQENELKSLRRLRSVYSGRKRVVKVPTVDNFMRMFKKHNLRANMVNAHALWKSLYKEIKISEEDAEETNGDTNK